MSSSYFNHQISATVFEALGLVLTSWRIYFRLKIARFWWEDAWAAILLLIGLAWVVSYWIYLFVADERTSIVVSWFISIGFTTIVMLARLSVLFSVIRIIHGSPHLLVFTYTCAVFFGACWGILVAEKARQCKSDPSWHRGIVSPQKSFCLVDKRISVFEFATSCVSILILVVLPLRMLWRVKLPMRQRRMILSIFASSVVLALAGVFHMVGQILNTLTVMVVGFHAEVALSIIVCNLLVVVTYTYHRLGCRTVGKTQTTDGAPAGDDDDFTTRATPLSSEPTRRFSLTTIDLEVLE